MKRFLLVANDEKPNALSLAEKARDYLHDKATVVAIESGKGAVLKQHKTDYVIIFGGDGTTLNAIHRMGVRPAPILTVNLGTLGYLAEVTPEECFEAFDTILANEHTIEKRMRLHGRLWRGDEECWHGHAFNEFVISPYTAGRIIDIEVCAQRGDSQLTRFTGDGLILASPTGSTAYSMSAGGPIVSPELHATVVTPICPHYLGNRPVVLDHKETIIVRHHSEQSAQLAVDGQEVIDFEADCHFEVNGSKHFIDLIRCKPRGRYDILRTKLGWGKASL